jgi:glucan phosphoethanolaminetransferase (alkaline phosphatase superfamily)
MDVSKAIQDANAREDKVFFKPVRKILKFLAVFWLILFFYTVIYHLTESHILALIPAFFIFTLWLMEWYFWRVMTITPRPGVTYVKKRR